MLLEPGVLGLAGDDPVLGAGYGLSHLQGLWHVLAVDHTGYLLLHAAVEVHRVVALLDDLRPEGVDRPPGVGHGARVAGELPVHVHVHEVGGAAPDAPVGEEPRHVEHRDADEGAPHLLGVQPPGQLQDRVGSLLLLPVDAAVHLEHGAVLDAPDDDHGYVPEAACAVGHAEALRGQEA